VDGFLYGLPWVLLALLGLIGFGIFVAFVASMIRTTWRQFGPGSRRPSIPGRDRAAPVRQRRSGSPS